MLAAVVGERVCRWRGGGRHAARYTGPSPAPVSPGGAWPGGAWPGGAWPGGASPRGASAGEVAGGVGAAPLLRAC